MPGFRPSASQTLETQKQGLESAGIDRLVSEKVSGVKQRRELEKLLDRLNPGDLLVVTKLDRLARSTLDLLQIVARIGQQGAGFKSLGDSWADTTTPHGRLMMTILAGIAEFERELILQRTGEGRARAKAEGVQFGRKPKLTPHQRREVLRRLGEGEAMRQIAKTFNVDHTTISRMAARQAATAGLQVQP
jgi:DNA invertase Pin-like site-specific DNA recombinase